MKIEKNGDSNDGEIDVSWEQIKRVVALHEGDLSAVDDDLGLMVGIISRLERGVGNGDCVELLVSLLGVIRELCEQASIVLQRRELLLEGLSFALDRNNEEIPF